VSQWRVEFYVFGNGNSPVLSWFQEQEPKVQAKLAQIFELLQDQGTAVGKPYVAPLVDKLYEIRVEQDTNIYRVVYFAYTGQRFILLHGFQKKTQKTPKQELALALERQKAFLYDEKLMPSQPAKTPKSKQKSKKRKK
jgi:phage-related protein